MLQTISSGVEQAEAFDKSLAPLALSPRLGGLQVRGHGVCHVFEEIHLIGTYTVPGFVINDSVASDGAPILASDGNRTEKAYRRAAFDVLPLLELWTCPDVTYHKPMRRLAFSVIVILYVGVFSEVSCFVPFIQGQSMEAFVA